MTTIQSKQNLVQKTFPESPATQVKMFILNNPVEGEKAINEWLKENDVIIHHIAQSQSEKSGNFIFVMTLFYSEND